MIRYRDPQFEFLGKFVARLDDLLNWVPSRLTAVMLVVAGGVSGGDWRAAWRVMVQQHGRTASPNAGWPMAAAAGALGVALAKAGAYRLEGGVDLPGWEAIRCARRLVAWAGAFGLVVCSGVSVVAGQVVLHV
jgi:adenosylcobinamide-phosphate synthase